MPTTATFDKEKLEVDAILASGLFNRAPNLAQLLKYVCGKYFEGSAEEIKEYNIAIDALGRPPHFDQKRDSIVRVEAHRLRKRLKDYYEGEGAAHEVHIEIPSGQYTPKFIFPVPPPTLALEKASLSPADVIFSPPPAESAVVSAVDSRMLTASPATKLGTAGPTGATKWLTAALFVVALAGVFLFLNRKHVTPSAPAATEVALPVSGDEVRLLCGVEAGTYIDAFERRWQSDRYFDGGYTTQAPRSQVVLGTRDQQLYRNRREGTFRYNIPVKPGLYELRLYFAETMFGDNNVAGGGETTRIFDVRLNGKTLVADFDVIADAGPSTADIKVFKDVSPAADGKIHLEFINNTNNPFVNAISILPGIPGKIRPYRIVARDRGLQDNEGHNWDPDRFARGGMLVARPDSNVQTADPELFRSERFGNLSYSIPVALPGKYGVNLYFAENWFGPGNPGGGGPGSRVFDILLNGVMLRKDFDILKEAGGTNRAVIVSAHGMEPNHQGKIVISLAPNRNYACINALEVIDESR